MKDQERPTFKFLANYGLFLILVLSSLFFKKALMPAPISKKPEYSRANVIEIYNKNKNELIVDKIRTDDGWLVVLQDRLVYTNDESVITELEKQK